MFKFVGFLVAFSVVAGTCFGGDVGCSGASTTQNTVVLLAKHPRLVAMRQHRADRLAARSMRLSCSSSVAVVAVKASCTCSAPQEVKLGHEPQPAEVTTANAGDSLYQLALRSAQYRAANGIKGHSQVDMSSGRMNGVGWSSFNSQPETCFWERRNSGAYAVARGSDGWYATLILR